MKNLARLFVYVLYFLLVSNPLSLYAQTMPYKITGKIIIGGEGKWDYLSVDTTFNRLFVAHETRVHIIDLNTNTVIGEIPDLMGVHGTAFAYEFGKGFISEGTGNSVTVFDLRTLQKTGRIKVTGEKPDAITYDPFSKRIFTSNNKSANITVIDALTNEVIGTVKLDGAPEASVPDLAGKIFVNLEDTNAVDIFNSATLEMIEKWSVKPCEIPTGLSVDRKNSRLFSAGRNKLMAVLNMESGRVINTLPIGGGVDGCVFDNKRGIIFCSNGEGSITVIKQDSPDKYKVLGNIKTMPGAKTIAIDEKTRRVFTAGMITEKNSKNFGVLIIERK